MIVELFSSLKAQELILVAKAHLAEYSYKPLLNLGFIISLAIATSTLLSILVLNHASEQQYQNANSRLKSPVAFYVVADDSQVITVEEFGRLRKLGFYQINAVNSFSKQLANQKKIAFRAMDILPLVLLEPESFSANLINMSESYANKLGLENNSKIKLANGKILTVRINQFNDWGDTALLDITLAWQLFPEQKGLSHLTVTSMSDSDKARLLEALPEHLSIQDTWSIEEREGFADALHLNLSALAVLGFIVSLFIAYQAANQAWANRALLSAQLRLLGVSLKSIQLVMLIEAVMLSLMATAVGIGIASVLVTLLLPVLGLTLEQLYQLRISGHFQWQWQYSLWAFLISITAVLVALFKQFTNISTAYIALSAKAQLSGFNQKINFSITLALLAAFFLWPDNSWHQLMLKYGALLLASVALLPILLTRLLSLLAKLSYSFHYRFIFQDAVQQVGRRFLPVAAFYLALTTSISAALLVSSFESSFVSYLNQLLNSDMYISYDSKHKNKIENWLQQQDAVDDYVLFRRTVAKLPNLADKSQDTVAIYDLLSHKQIESLLLKVHWQSSDRKYDSCFVNEQLAFKFNIKDAQLLELQQGTHTYQCLIRGIYYDYGNQGYGVKIQRVSVNTFLTGWKETGFSVFFKDSQELNKQEVAAALGVDEAQIYLPEQIKNLSLDVFEQTFVLTRGIAFVLLAIACFGLFLSANNLELARKPELYILNSLGYSKGELYHHMLFQWGLLAFGTVILSWPIAAVLADALVSQVLAVSFGWSMPLELDISAFATTSIVGMLILLPALAIPLHKLNLRASLS